MRLSVVQESSARRSPHPGRALGRQEVAGEGKHYGAGQAGGGLHERHLQQAAALAFLARLAGFAMIGGAFHVVATVLGHIPHHRHAHGFHRTRFCRCLDARHPAEGKHQANQKNEAAPQVAFHVGESSRWSRATQLLLCEACMQDSHDEAPLVKAYLSVKRAARVTIECRRRCSSCIRMRPFLCGLCV